MTGTRLSKDIQGRPGSGLEHPNPNSRITGRRPWSDPSEVRSTYHGARGEEGGGEEEQGTVENLKDVGMKAS